MIAFKLLYIVTKYIKTYLKHIAALDYGKSLSIASAVTIESPCLTSNTERSNLSTCISKRVKYTVYFKIVGASVGSTQFTAEVRKSHPSFV